MSENEVSQKDRIRGIIGVEKTLGAYLTPRQRAELLTGSKPPFQVLNEAANPPEKEVARRIQGVEDQLGRAPNEADIELIRSGRSPFEVLERAITDPTKEMPNLRVIPPIEGYPIPPDLNETKKIKLPKYVGVRRATKGRRRAEPGKHRASRNRPGSPLTRLRELARKNG